MARQKSLAAGENLFIMMSTNHSTAKIKALLFAALLLAAPFLLSACLTNDSNPNNGIPTSENSALKLHHTVPAQVKVGDVFSMQLTVSVKKSLPAVSVKEQLSGLKLVDKGEFIGIEQNVLRGVILNAKSGDTQVFNYKALCEHATTYTVIGFADSKNVSLVMDTAEVKCVD
jgi:hypothetical protein